MTQGAVMNALDLGLDLLIQSREFVGKAHFWTNLLENSIDQSSLMLWLGQTIIARKCASILSNSRCSLTILWLHYCSY